MDRAGAGPDDGFVQDAEDSRHRPRGPTLDFSVGLNHVAQARFVVSRLVQVSVALPLLRDTSRAPRLERWARQARRRVDPARVALLLALADPPSWYVPDFMVAFPETYRPTLEEELAGVAAAEPEIVAQQLELAFAIGPVPTQVLVATRLSPVPVEQRRAPVPPVLAEALAAAGPRGVAERAAIELERFWAVTLADDWQWLCRVLEDDVLHRGRLLSRAGATALFADLAPELRWDGATLALAIPPYQSSFLINPPLLLAPTVFADRPTVWLRAPDRAMFGYPARGRATAWSTLDRSAVHPVPTNRLLLGGRRTALLVDLVCARSTTELAIRHGIRASTVSHHLGVLRGAGLVVRQRIGREVLYERTPRGTALVEALDLEPA